MEARPYLDGTNVVNHLVKALKGSAIDGGVDEHKGVGQLNLPGPCQVQSLVTADLHNGQLDASALVVGAEAVGVLHRRVILRLEAPIVVHKGGDQGGFAGLGEAQDADLQKAGPLQK